VRWRYVDTEGDMGIGRLEIGTLRLAAIGHHTRAFRFASRDFPAPTEGEGLLVLDFSAPFGYQRWAETFESSESFGPADIVVDEFDRVSILTQFKGSMIVGTQTFASPPSMYSTLVAVLDSLTGDAVRAGTIGDGAEIVEPHISRGANRSLFFSAG